MAPPLTFIWRHDRRLDKSTQAFPKYEPILYNKVDKHKRHLRYWIYSKKKLFWALFLAEIKALVICEVAMSTSPKPMIVPVHGRGCGLTRAESKIQRCHSTQLPIHPLTRAKREQKKHCCEKGSWRARKKIIHNIQMQDGHRAGWREGGVLDWRHAFQSTHSCAHVHDEFKRRHESAQFACKGQLE